MKTSDSGREFLFFSKNSQTNLYKTLDKFVSVCYNKTRTKLAAKFNNLHRKFEGRIPMKKSIYSLVLMDEVVEAVDRMAYAMHTSRSNLINQILAEHLSCITPEMYMQTVFSQIEALMEQRMEPLRILESTSAHMLAMHSPLAYKYKPTLQYSVELYRTPKQNADGRLRIGLRTQNAELLTMLDRFFRFWVLLEQTYGGGAAEYVISAGRLERTLHDPTSGDGERFGELICGYIDLLDSCVKLYFSGASHPQPLEVPGVRCD